MAKTVAGRAVRDGLYSIGTGAGPVDVFGLGRQSAGGEARAEPGAAAPAGEVS